MTHPVQVQAYCPLDSLTVNHWQSGTGVSIILISAGSTSSSSQVFGLHHNGFLLDEEKSVV